MDLPLFFKENVDDAFNLLTLDEETSKHVVQVLRMKPGEFLRITNGKGRVYTGEILKDHKKHCEVKIIESKFIEDPARKISIGISLLKNASRFEWFLEKATEIGIREIIPIICEKTEKQHFRYDRMNNICISAMLQSQQVWLPRLREPVQFKSLFEDLSCTQKLIAHCKQGEKRSLSAAIEEGVDSTLILIGPEGDFTNEEVALAERNQFRPVSLGETRLRAETAAVVAAAVLALHRKN